MTLVDPHVKVLDETVREIAIDRNLDALVYAPHFTPWPTIVERARRYSSEDLVVVPGREIFTGRWNNRKHVLALDLSMPVPDFIGLPEAIAELRRQEAYVIVPHPAYLTISLTSSDLDRFRSDIDAVEVYNPKFLPWHGPRAVRLADRIDRPAVVSSYAHLRRTVGVAAIEVSGPIDTMDDFVRTLRTEGVSGHRYRSGPSALPWSVPEVGHLLWENSGKKFARIARTGKPATHYSNPMYEGRFDG